MRLSQASAATDYSSLVQPFSQYEFSHQDLRFLQAGLAFLGYYRGLLDGTWGAISERALDRYSLAIWKDAPPKNIDAAILAASTLKAFDSDGWQIIYMTNYDISLLMPQKAVKPGPNSPNFLDYQHTHSSLSYSFSLGSIDEALRLHNYTESYGANPASNYVVRTQDLMVTSATAASGGSLYTRSDLTSSGWTTVMLYADGRDANILNAVASSISPGRAKQLGIAPAGALYSITMLAVKAAQDPSLTGNPNVAAQPTSPANSGGGDTGSGIYVAPGGFVLTNAHVVKACKSITIDGAAAELINSSTSLDLALLRAPSEGNHAFAEFAGSPAQLNSDVTVVGYPLTGLLGGLNVTRGSVSSLKGLEGNPLQMQISAPVQPGNSGGPVVDAHGAVVGVVVSKLNAEAVAKNIGDIPQNVNFAIRAGIAKVFLSSNGVQPALSDVTKQVSPVDLAAEAERYTAFVMCRQ